MKPTVIGKVMKKTNGENNKPDVKVILVLPLGVDESIFPWGIHLIKDYLLSSCDFITILVWDFRSDVFFADLNIRYSNLLGKLFLSLKPEQNYFFFGITTNPYIFLGLAAFLGKDFFRLTGANKSLRHSCSKDLSSLQEEVNSYIVNRISDYSRDNPDSPRIWGISVYDHTLFNSLYIARLIKENDPTASVIMGGEYFDFQSGEQTRRNISFVDGVVVGYGEEVMRRVVLEHRRGIPVENLQIPGLVNHTYINLQDQEESNILRTVNIPPFYKDFSRAPGVSYVQLPNQGEIRILAQRGCSWGKCSFCTLFDRNMFFQVPVKHLLQGIQSALTVVKYRGRGTSITICFDSNDNNLEMFLPFIKYLDNIKDLKVRFNIDLWLHVKKFRRELVEMLANINNKKISVRFFLNFESLNYGTLKNMRKGHLPLQAIEAAKAIQDSGHSFNTNYMIHFPLEDRENISQEVQILWCASHLFIPPKGGINLFPYGTNNRDAISENPREYRIRAKPLAGDLWLKDTFGLCLPFTIWSYSYEEKLSFHIDRLLIYTYYKTIKTRTAVYRPYLVAKMHWGKVEITFQDRLGFFSRVLTLFGWNILHHILQWIGKGRAYGKRTRLFFYLSEISKANTPKSSPGMSLEIKGEGPYFFLQEGRLNKDYRAPGKKEKWLLPLNSDEQKILRYLYWQRKTKDVIYQFKDEMSESHINGIINRHLKLGSLVQFKDSLLCVVNDPGYWK